MQVNNKVAGRSRKLAVVLGSVALAVGLGLGARAFAQQHTDGVAAHHAHAGKDGPMARFSHMCATMDARQAGMLAFAQVRLGITDAERPAWNKFAAAIKASSAPVQKVCASVAGQPEPKTLPEHLQRMEAIETAHLEQLRQVTPAVEELYGALSAKQKELADHLVEHMMHRRGPGMHPGFMHRGSMHDWHGAPAGKQPG